MNCKKGDLAIIVSGSIPQNIGLIIRCDELVCGLWWKPGAPAWRVTDRAMWAVMNDGSIKFCQPPLRCYDEHLRPIRDDDGEDEVLRIAGKPKELESA